VAGTLTHRGSSSLLPLASNFAVARFTGPEA